MYKKIRESKTGHISAGHRTTLIPYHDRLLTLDRSGSWTVEKVPKL